jgi:hypothetical protein
MPKQKLTTARQILAALGGVEKIAVLTQKSAKVVYHWQAINQFPSHTYCIMRRELKRHGYKTRKHLWAMTGFKKPQRQRKKAPRKLRWDPKILPPSLAKPGAKRRLP